MMLGVKIIILEHAMNRLGFVCHLWSWLSRLFSPALTSTSHELL